MLKWKAHKSRYGGGTDILVLENTVTKKDISVASVGWNSGKARGEPEDKNYIARIDFFNIHVVEYSSDQKLLKKWCEVKFNDLMNQYGLEIKQ